MASEHIVKVTSKDGTTIAAGKSGQGPPLVLVHGATADRTRWLSVLSYLEPHATCYALDRRGRGLSGDGPRYALEREAEDVAAVCDAIEGPVDLLGHSYGGLCAVEAASRTTNVRRLVLYEPAVPVGAAYPPGTVERLEALLARGDRDGAVRSMLRDVAGLSEAELAALRAHPSWQGRLAAAHTLPRELRVDATWRPDPARLARIASPTLLLVGGASPPMYREGAELLRKAIPNARIVTLPGQGHVAMNTAPEMFSREVLAFLA